MTVEWSFSTESPVLSEITGAVDGVYALNAEHEEEGLSHLIDLFRYGPRNQALLRAILAQVQEAEDAVWAVSQGFALATATGDQLDILGRLVGEERADRLDAEYRRAIYARRLVNSSDGTLERLLEIGTTFAPGETILSRMLPPAAVELRFSDYGDLDLQSAHRLLTLAKAGGVRLLVYLQTSDIGAVDGTPAGGVVGAVDGTPAGLTIGAGA